MSACARARRFAHQFAKRIFKKQRITSRCALAALHGCASVYFNAPCIYEGELDWQQKSGCLAVPVVKAGCGRWRVLSRQYEAYVRDQCWTVEIIEMRREEGHKGLTESEITGGLVPWPQTILAVCHTQTNTHTYLSYCIFLTSAECGGPALQRVYAKPRVNKIAFHSEW